MIDHPFQHLVSFYGPWSASLAAAVMQDAQVAAPLLTIQFDGMAIPVVQVVLAAAGVLLARPLAPKQERSQGTLRFLLVSAIMLIVAVTWAAQAQPGPLFAFVVAIGLGFSGYSLIELAGREIENMIKAIFASVTGAIGPRNSGDDL
ncbi:MAG: hypothetical protein VYD90_13105 [Pseudomonadota bacterium]|nr:hypothetical protein [Pseudomonadota bacterium]